jgi:hypothetical protein
VRVVTDVLSADDMVRLHAANNIYISASHGEAWDMPAFDARCAGNRLVVSPGGAPAEYRGPDDVLIQSPGDIPCHPGYRWEHDALWPAVPMEVIGDALLAAHPPARRRHPASFPMRFGAMQVGREMGRLIQGLIGPAPSYDWLPPEAGTPWSSA